MTEAPRFIGIEMPCDERRRAIDAAYRRDESAAVTALLRAAQLDPPTRARIASTARALVEQARGADVGLGLDAFLGEYALSSEEGVVLMCLAEALLRIPDDDTRDRLIRDKLSEADWARHLGHSGSILVNASTVGLLLTGRVVRLGGDERDIAGLLGRLVARAGEPVIRAALVQAMRIMGQQFVMGRTIDEALGRAAKGSHRLYRHSFDMLGEAALTARDAERYFESYAAAIAAIGATSTGMDTGSAAGISVKLSALHPRYGFAQRERVLRELVPRLSELVALARDANVAMTVDAEEADRLELSLDVFEAVFREPGFGGWDGFGLAVQAYQKRALPLLDWLAALAAEVGRRIPVRLVKGAYWDSEIKRAQEQGLDGYPVFTRKSTTDASYIACIRRLFADRQAFHPQFATHNAHSVATVLALAPEGAEFEFQRLHGMGEALYDPLVADDAEPRVDCRVYAPVGSHEDLLPYLVRRLLENGANTSFVNRLADRKAPVEALIADPITATAALTIKPHPRIPQPREILPGRKAAAGIDLTDPLALAALQTAMDEAARAEWRAAPVVAGRSRSGEARDAADPADRRRVIGKVVEATPDDVDAALAAATRGAGDWDRLGGDRRAGILERAADLFERDIASLMALAVREGGKSIPDALGEVREAVDYCRYYAALARAQFAAPLTLPGPTGERNTLALHGRGVFACISPWNFPIAIFIGQVAAALAAGNAVVAKPAEQTPLCAAAALRLLHEAGVPAEALHLLPGDGSIGAALVEDMRVNGIAFTGSTETAQGINRVLAARSGPIVPLIAETGGQNAMIVDSSALPEQVVRDVIASAFLSAGQRCSASRVLFLQDDTAPRIVDMLTGAMAELAIGDPGLLSTDVGPVIDDDARDRLLRHARRMAGEGRLLHRCDLPPYAAHGCFVPPMAFEIDRLSRLEREVFGPILHVIRWRAGRLDEVIDAINATGYGLTAGIHSRIDETVRQAHARLRAGNTYVNRSIVGAVVGVQPFGGEGLSGTGPKAGGPHYLPRFAVERTLSVNTAAIGGNATLLAQSGDEPG
jgi:RHH-type proline utilization regulon transcriptional repressor/proline dehydrogenase/delta 1-pyrroline-5-carboxylate dehydrogenase